MNNQKKYFKNPTHSYFIKFITYLIFFCFVKFYFISIVYAQVETYQSQVFEVLEKKLGNINLSKLNILNIEKYKKTVNFKDETGKTINIDIGIELREVRDMKIGDVDNDGENELVFITKTHLFVVEQENGHFVIDASKTTPLYGDDRKGKQSIISPWKKYSIMNFKNRQLSEKDREGGRIAIGDVNNDGKNEIVVTRTFLYPHESQGIIVQFICANDILVWRKDHFEIIDSIIAGDYKAGVFIVDVDNDGLNELLISGININIFKSTGLQKNSTFNDTGKWWYRALNNGFTMMGFIDLNTNGGNQRTVIKELDGKIILSQCTLWDIGKEYIKNIGRIRTFELDPKVINDGGTVLGKRKCFDIKEFREIAEPIQLPISKYKDTEFPMVKLKSLVLGDVDGDGKAEVIANMENEAHLYEIE